MIATSAVLAVVTAAAASASAGETDRDPRLYIQDGESPPSLFKAVTVLPHENYVTTAILIMNFAKACVSPRDPLSLRFPRRRRRRRRHPTCSLQFPVKPRTCRGRLRTPPGAVIFIMHEKNKIVTGTSDKIIIEMAVDSEVGVEHAWCGRGRGGVGCLAPCTEPTPEPSPQRRAACRRTPERVPVP